jgi:ectoine hydroxylase-related dioxygenase (phytanoyl-CoA dioxygenase family)
MPFLRTKMGPASMLVELSSLISLPGAEKQQIHSDTPWKEDNDLIISGFLAMSPITIDRRPTCVFPGTHMREFHASISALANRATYYTADGTLENYVVGAAALPQTPRFSEGSVRSHGESFAGIYSENALLEPGDLLLFDTRLFHYGSANISESPRPLIYFSFQSPQNQRASIRSIDGFTYHCDKSVRGKSQLKDFGEPYFQDSSGRGSGRDDYSGLGRPMKIMATVTGGDVHALPSSRISRDW